MRKKNGQSLPQLISVWYHFVSPIRPQCDLHVKIPSKLNCNEGTPFLTFCESAKVTVFSGLSCGNDRLVVEMTIRLWNGIISGVVGGGGGGEVSEGEIKNQLAFRPPGKPTTKTKATHQCFTTGTFVICGNTKFES